MSSVCCMQPDHQSKGLGGRMLQALCSVADAANKWTYLEATNENNARLYERYEG
jgi:L-amino acid N-acyltransferase YncA